MTFEIISLIALAGPGSLADTSGVAEEARSQAVRQNLKPTTKPSYKHSI